MKTLPYGVMIILNKNHVLTIYVYLVLHEHSDLMKEFLAKAFHRQGNRG